MLYKKRQKTKDKKTKNQKEQKTFFGKIEPQYSPIIFYSPPLDPARMPKIHVISAAPSRSYRPDAIQQASWEEVDRRAIVRDGHIIPLVAALGLSGAAKIPLIPGVTTEDMVKASIRQTAADEGKQVSEAKVKRDARALLQARQMLKKGDIVGLKQGTKIRAIVEITSDYQFCPEEPWGWHTWIYKRLHVVTEAEWPANYRGLLKTFHPNFLSWPL
jgi:hypothetical protein